MERFKKIALEAPDTYFTKITVDDRKKLMEWLANQKGDTNRVKMFLGNVRMAIPKINYDFWIANMEPSVAEGKIYYLKGENVGDIFAFKQYEKMAKEYAPERGSRLANIHELFVWYALRIANGLWTLDYVCNDSSSAGNYRNAPNHANGKEKTGARTCGGYCDGQGNTCKLVTNDYGFSIVGGCCWNFGHKNPVADEDIVYDCTDPEDFFEDTSGVLVLTKQ